MDFLVKKIPTKDTKNLILNYHYAKRMPCISYAFGLFDKSELIGCVTYGMPASPRVSDGLCGKEYSKDVLELNRLVLKHNRKNEASYLISKSLKLLPKNKIIISYADTSQNHVGYVYQATNFFYLGLSAIRTDRVFIDGTKQKHGRHIISTEISDIYERTKLVQRPRKHRYLILTGDNKYKKSVLKSLRYKIENYPKKLLEEPKEFA
jgi:hypothetical protein